MPASAAADADVSGSGSPAGHAHLIAREAEIGEAFGARLRELRRARGWPVGPLARESSIAVPTIRRIEQERQKARQATLDALLGALEVPHDELTALEARVVPDKLVSR